MGTRKVRIERAKMRSPGRPPVLHRAQRRPFWQAIAEGAPARKQLEIAGVSQAVGTRWFRECGGMPPSHLAPSAPPATGRTCRWPSVSRSPCCAPKIREFGDRAATWASCIDDLAGVAAQRCHSRWWLRLSRDHGTVACRSRRKASQACQTGDQCCATALCPRSAGRQGRHSRREGHRWSPGSLEGTRHGRRQHRRWSRAWSPEQIAHRLPIDFPDDTSMRISHEAIYQALYIQGRGALRRELTACLRTGRALRVPRERTRGRGKSFVTPEILISERPAAVDDRAIPGHWEGDLILGLASSAIGTLVERTTRFTMLLHLPPLPGHGHQPRDKHGPALAGHGAEAVRDAITRAMASLPEQLRRSLTWDQGAEMSQHAQLSIDTGLEVYFCDPQSPWQRGTNENTNGLLRQYFPKGTDLSAHRPSELQAVALALNTRPRKTLGWRTPAEAFNEVLRSADQNGVATTS